MEPPAARAVVLVRFPFSDLSGSKFRPALVLGDPGRGDFVLCQITSNPYADPFAVELTDADFADGSLQRVSFARPGKLFTAHQSLLSARVGILVPAAHARVVERIVALLSDGLNERPR